MSWDMEAALNSFSFTVDRHLNRYGIQTRPTTIEIHKPYWLNDIDIPNNIIFMYDKSRIAIIKNVDTGEREIVFDYKPEGDKKKKSRASEKNRQRKHR